MSLKGLKLTARTVKLIYRKLIFRFSGHKVLGRQAGPTLARTVVVAQLQCDQMARFFFKIWPFTAKKLAQLKKNFQKNGQNFETFLLNPQNIAKEMKKFPKVEKFRQIWSHCSVGRAAALPTPEVRSSNPVIGKTLY